MKTTLNESILKDLHAAVGDRLSTSRAEREHHGSDFLREEHGEAVAVMRAIKRALDPHDIMNRGKVFRD